MTTTDTTTAAAEPFDPEVPKRLAAFLAARKTWTLDGTVASVPKPGHAAYNPARVELTEADLHQLLEQLTYAESTRLQLAKACATLRQERNEARIIACALAEFLIIIRHDERDLAEILHTYGSVEELPAWLTAHAHRARVAVGDAAKD